MSTPPIITRDGRVCSRLAAGLLGILLGWLGAHKFYMGYVGQGLVLLLGSIAGAILIFPPFVAGLVGIAEGVIYLTLTDDQFTRKYLSSKRGWF